MNFEAKKWIYDIDPYKPGEGGKGFIKLASNENPLGASPKAIKAFQDFTAFEKYPDGSAKELKKELVAKYKIKEEHLICGAGSDELIRMVAYAYAGVGDEVVCTQHSFLMYRLSAKAVGAKPIIVKEKNYKADVDLILNAVTKKTKIIYLANPNNPTGTHLVKHEIERLIKNTPKHILIVLDAAYAEYMEDKDYSSGVEFVRKHENVLMLRTFSKIYGLASLRLGWGYGSKKVIDVLNRIRGPFNVSAVALACGVSALRDNSFVMKSKTHNMIWRNETQTAFDDFDLPYIPSEANFLLTDLGSEKRAAQVFEKLKSKKIFVRPVHAYDLPQFLRISIGKEKEMQTLFDALKRIL